MQIFNTEFEFLLLPKCWDYTPIPHWAPISACFYIEFGFFLFAGMLIFSRKGKNAPKICPISPTYGLMFILRLPRKIMSFSRHIYLCYGKLWITVCDYLAGMSPCILMSSGGRNETTWHKNTQMEDSLQLPIPAYPSSANPEGVPNASISGQPMAFFAVLRCSLWYTLSWMRCRSKCTFQYLKVRLFTASSYLGNCGICSDCHLLQWKWN